MIRSFSTQSNNFLTTIEEISLESWPLYMLGLHNNIVISGLLKVDKHYLKSFNISFMMKVSLLVDKLYNN